jgi:hypothetical protein
MVRAHPVALLACLSSCFGSELRRLAGWAYGCACALARTHEVGLLSLNERESTTPLETIPLPSQCVDAVVVVNAIHLVGNPTAALAECH